ncbi:hypothetical protein [Ensifer canadensis]
MSIRLFGCAVTIDSILILDRCQDIALRHPAHRMGYAALSVDQHQLGPALRANPGDGDAAWVPPSLIAERPCHHQAAQDVPFATAPCETKLFGKAQPALGDVFKQ